MANKITVLLDLVTDKATASAKGFKSSVAEAEGAANKFKAGASSAFASLSTVAGPALIGAGTALVAFGAKAVAASQETALAAGKLAEATGLTVESASRLNEVASDLGISGDTLTGIVKKMSVEIGKGNPLLDQYGIALQHASDGSADINATLLDTIRRIQAIEDPTKRAAAAQAAFGRGFADAAELIGMSADELQAKLDSVSSAKVVTDAELERARKFRDSLEDLKDVGEDLTASVGQLLIPAMQELADDLQVVADAAVVAKEKLDQVPGLPKWLTALKNLNVVGQQVLFYKKLGEGVEFLQDKWDGSEPASDRFADSILRGGDAAETATPAIDGATTAVDGLATAAGDAADEVVDLGDKAANSGPKIGDMAGALDDVNDALRKTADEGAQKFQDALQGVLDKVDEVAQGVRDRINMEGLLDDITAQFRAVQQAGEDAAENGKEGTAQYREEVRQLRLMILNLLGDLDNLSANDKIRLSTEIERGSLDDLFKILGELQKGVTVPVVFGTPQQAFSGVNATIASNAIPNMSFANLNPGPVDNSQTTIIYPVGSSPTTTAIDQRLYQTRNGPR